MPVKREAIAANIQNIEYGNDIQVAVAYPLSNPSDLLVTIPATERLFELPQKKVANDLASNPFKALLLQAKKGSKDGKKNFDTATVLVRAETSPDGFILPNNRLISAVPFDAFVLFAQYQCSVGNTKALSLLVSGFADSFKSLALAQIKQQMSLGDRLTLLKSWQDVMASIRSMNAIELEELIESRSLYPDPSPAAQIRYMKLLQVNDPSIDPLEAMGRSGYLAAFLKAKFSPPVESEQRQANLVEMADYVINAP